MNVKIGSYQNSQVDLLKHVQSSKMKGVCFRPLINTAGKPSS